MPADSFKFISPGVFINEIDNSQLPSLPRGVGPVVIGRAQQGPALIPTRVTSFQDFVQVFGAPVAGNTNDDISRNGNTAGPMYGTYAAQAWLRNNSPVTYVRLVGRQHSSAPSTGYAGWQTTNTDVDPDGSAGGAYGLFVYQSSSAGIGTGSLAAVWYVNSGSVALSGTAYAGDAATLRLSASAVGGVHETKKATNTYIGAVADKSFKVVVKDGSGTEVVDAAFNFTAADANFVRNVFNTNPTLTNSTITDSTSEAYTNYWLGASYEDEITNYLTGTGPENQYGVMIPLQKGTTVVGADFRRDYADPKSGWYISQDLGDTTGSFDAATQTKLFRFVARNTGRWASRNIKVSLSNIRPSSDIDNSYGTFSVQIRAMSDTDSRPKVLEQFSNCNLNPQSENYVGRKIGNKYLTWDDETRRYKEYGDYVNLSNYVFMDMNTQVDEAKTNPELLPFGVFGPPKFKNFTDRQDPGTVDTLVTGGFDFFNGTSFDNDDADKIVSGSVDAVFSFPTLRLRLSASEGNPTDPRAVYYGVDTTFDRQGRASKTIGAYTGPKPSGIDLYVADTSADAETEASWVFTLDDMMNTSTSLTGTNVYVSGSRQASPSPVAGVRADNPNLTYIASGSYRDVLDNGANRFTTVLHGGFDGLDIKESEPFRNTQWDGTSTELNSYTFNSMKVAIDSLRDPESVEFDLSAMPGITNNTLNRNLIDMCEERGDSLAIVDLQGGFVPDTENTQSLEDRLGSVDSTIGNKKNNLQINSSFGCTYYPWVQVQDTINGALLWVPPSVAAIGAMSYGQAKQELWFAPAGFTRGGLSTNNAAGIPVVGVRERLISTQRDDLYEANINPIAQFPAEGIVIFGQKTLQVTPSALDRINVRRLLIFLKRRISQVAATLLFDQNVETTWQRFRSRVGPVLADVKAGLGLTDYKLILDDTTTTPDLIDRNIMYAKVYLKPARAIEFIAIDFVITDSGASFED